MLDPRVWLLWALTAMVAASSSRNPLYIILLVLVAMVVAAVCAPDQGRRWLSPLRFAAIAVPLAAVFNGLTAHLGDTVLFRLPSWLPLLGGRVTLEALAFGAMNGLTLTAIFSGFAVFNQATPASDLVRLTPRAFHEAGVTRKTIKERTSMANSTVSTVLVGLKQKGLVSQIKERGPYVISEEGRTCLGKKANVQS